MQKDTRSGRAGRNLKHLLYYVCILGYTHCRNENPLGDYAHRFADFHHPDRRHLPRRGRGSQHGRRRGPRHGRHSGRSFLCGCPLDRHEPADLPQLHQLPPRFRLVGRPADGDSLGLAHRHRRGHRLRSRRPGDVPLQMAEPHAAERQHQRLPFRRRLHRHDLSDHPGRPQGRGQGPDHHRRRRPGVWSRHGRRHPADRHPHPRRRSRRPGHPPCRRNQLFNRIIRHGTK